ncbi:MAG: phosphatidylserine/phosphatidylglycerophosphate/cardiolipin synthase family protein [Desulfuromonadales bacterium]|nr:phosphatidylserine/phosphatidylglycerophosphate/cardiolipin synthase family protein [Desulfuromonadales bacterium]
MQAVQKEHRFPWRQGNRFRLLVDGDHYFPAMLAAIDGAQRYVLLLMYLCSSGKVTDQFIEALTAAAGRGVRVQLLLDDFGSLALRRPDRQRLLDGQVELVFCNPLRVGRWSRNLLRDHRKLLVVDGKVGFTGGAGLTDEFDPVATPELYWHDLMLEIRGPCVGDWQSLFRESWEKWSGRPLTMLELPPPPFEGGHPGRVAVQGATFDRADIVRSLIRRIRRARQQVWLATPYFLPSWKLRRNLRRQVQAGTEVRLLLPGPLTDNQPVRALGGRYYEKLLRDGIRIFEYQPRFLHAKIHLCDHWASIGSTNLDRWSYRWNLDANQELEDPAVIGELQRLFEHDFAVSRELRYDDWLKRSWPERLTERFWGLVLEGTVWVSERRPGRRGRS